MVEESHRLLSASEAVATAEGEITGWLGTFQAEHYRRDGLGPVAVIGSKALACHGMPSCWQRCGVGTASATYLIDDISRKPP